jgi:hypothetical protein
MKKLIFLTVTALFLCGAQVFAQQAIETSEELQKLGRQSAFVMDFDFPAKTVKAAIEQRLKNENLKGKTSQGATKYEQIHYPAIADVAIDLYIKIVNKKEKSTVFVFVSKGYDNFVSSNNDPVVAANAKAFLESLTADVQKYDHQNQVAAQEKETQKAQKEYDKLTKQQEKLTKDMQKAQENLNSQKGKLNNLNLNP